MLSSLEGLGVLSTTVAASYTREIKKHNYFCKCVATSYLTKHAVSGMLGSLEGLGVLSTTVAAS